MLGKAAIAVRKSPKKCPNSVMCRILNHFSASLIHHYFFTEEVEDALKLRDEVGLEPRVVDHKEFPREAGDVATVHPLPPTAVLGDKLQPCGILGVSLAQLTVQV